MKTVTKEEFYAFMGPKDVHPTPRSNIVEWKTRDGTIIGRSWPGYLLKEPERYEVRE